MILKWKTLFFTSSIIRYNNNKDLSSALPSNFESLLNILISDFSVVAIDSGILYRNNALAFLAATITSKSSFYLILYNRYYSTLYS